MYAWEYFDSIAEAQADALPREAVVPFLELLTGLADDPWNYGRLPAEPLDKPLRMLPFGPEGEGQLTFQIYDMDRKLYIVRVMWLG